MLCSDHIFKKYAIVCEVIDACETLSGRKRFHKIMHICKELKYPIHETFKWGNREVYSSELSGEIEALQDSGFVKVTSGQNGLCHTLSKEGKNFLDEIKKDILLDYDEDVFDKLVRYLNERDLNKLEIDSSIMFLKDGENQEEVISTLASLYSESPRNQVESKPHQVTLIQISNMANRNKIMEEMNEVEKLKSDFFSHSFSHSL